jgi:hypothetical protein
MGHWLPDFDILDIEMGESDSPGSPICSFVLGFLVSNPIAVPNLERSLDFSI